MHLTAFNARALTDVAAAVKTLESQGAAELVLDLRDNRGGLVQEGIEIAKLFLEGGPLSDMWCSHAASVGQIRPVLHRCIEIAEITSCHSGVLALLSWCNQDCLEWSRDARVVKIGHHPEPVSVHAIYLVENTIKIHHAAESAAKVEKPSWLLSCSAFEGATHHS